MQWYGHRIDLRRDNEDDECEEVHTLNAEITEQLDPQKIAGGF